MHHLATKTHANIAGIKGVIEYGQYSGNFEDSFQAALSVGIRGLGPAQLFEIVNFVLENDLTPDELLEVVRVIGGSWCMSVHALFLSLLLLLPLLPLLLLLPLLPLLPLLLLLPQLPHTHYVCTLSARKSLGITSQELGVYLSRPALDGMNLCKLAILEAMRNSVMDAEKCSGIVDKVWPIEVVDESDRRRSALRMLKDMKKGKALDERVANLEEILETMRGKEDDELKVTIRHREHAKEIIDGIKTYPCSFIFGEVLANRVVFLVDCSGSMVRVWSGVEGGGGGGERRGGREDMRGRTEERGERRGRTEERRDKEATIEGHTPIARSHHATPHRTKSSSRRKTKRSHACVLLFAISRGSCRSSCSRARKTASLSGSTLSRLLLIRGASATSWSRRRKTRSGKPKNSCGRSKPGDRPTRARPLPLPLTRRFTTTSRRCTTLATVSHLTVQSLLSTPGR